MGFLSSARAAILRGLAQAMTPPPPPDITRWCEDNIVFDERSPFPGEINIDRFPFLREIHEALKQGSIDGNTLNIGPSILLVGPDKETEAEMFVANITATQTSAVNTFSGRLAPVVSAEITDNSWYLL